MHAYDKWQRTWDNDTFTSDASGIMTLEIADNNPWSRGSVSLRSGNPFDPPAVRCGHLTLESDVQTLILAIKQARKVVRAVHVIPSLLISPLGVTSLNVWCIDQYEWDCRS
jgi:choline dehydrogenase-like flavoprotein